MISGWAWASFARSGPSPHHNEFELGEGLPHGLPGRDREREVFLSGEPTHVNHHGGFFIGSPRGAERRIAALGCEESGIDPATKDAQIGEAFRLEMSAQLLGWNKGAVGVPVDVAQPAEDALRHETVAVMLPVTVEVCVETSLRGAGPAGGRRARHSIRAGPSVATCTRSGRRSCQSRRMRRFAGNPKRKSG